MLAGAGAWRRGARRPHTSASRAERPVSVAVSGILVIYRPARSSAARDASREINIYNKAVMSCRVISFARTGAADVRDPTLLPCQRSREAQGVASWIQASKCSKKQDASEQDPPRRRPRRRSLTHRSHSVMGTQPRRTQTLHLHTTTCKGTAL